MWQHRRHHRVVRAIIRLVFLMFIVIVLLTILGRLAGATTAPACYYGMRTCSPAGQTAVGLINSGRASTGLSADTISYTQIVQLSPATAVDTQISLTREVRGLSGLTPSTRFNTLVAGAAGAGVDPTCAAVAEAVVDCQEIWGGSGATSPTAVAGVYMMVYQDSSSYNLTCAQTGYCTGHRDSILFAAPAGYPGYIDTVCDGPSSGIMAQGSCSSMIWWTAPAPALAPAPVSTPASTPAPAPAAAETNAPASTSAPAPVSTPASTPATTVPAATTPAPAPASAQSTPASAAPAQSPALPAPSVDARHARSHQTHLDFVLVRSSWWAYGHPNLAFIFVGFAALSALLVLIIDRFISKFS